MFGEMLEQVHILLLLLLLRKLTGTLFHTVKRHVTTTSAVK